MQCDRARELLGAYIDGELAGTERRDVAAHLQSCAVCAAEGQDMRRVGRQIAAIGREAAPRSLANRIRAELAATGDTAISAVAVGSAANPRKLLRPLTSRLGRQAAVVAAACLVTAVMTWIAADRWNEGVRLEREIVAAHIRSLLLDSPIQVASSDAHTVKPWFMGRIDFAPDVKDLTLEGYPLAGGRLDYVGGHRVGTLVYRRRQHVVNVFMWPSSQAEPAMARAHSRNGYNLLSWSKAGVTYWAVSDLNAGELRQLQSLL